MEVGRVWVVLCVESGKVVSGPDPESLIDEEGQEGCRRGNGSWRGWAHVSGFLLQNAIPCTSGFLHIANSNGTEFWS